MVKENLHNGGLRVWIMYMSALIIAICEKEVLSGLKGLIVQAKLTAFVCMRKQTMIDKVSMNVVQAHNCSS